MAKHNETTSNNHESSQFPPVVSVLGHVDHGKTSLLDAIRKTNQAAREKGGITQKIGASHIEVTHEGKRRSITFIDTPGHEAFADMRSQGVSASDIVLLIVAADDGIKPQTLESLKKIQEATIPFIVVFTKADLETAQIERARQQLMREGVLFEGLGGEVPSIAVSSKTGDKIQDLLELIILMYDLLQIKKEVHAPFMGVVIDSKLDKRRGIVTSIVVKRGTVSIGDKFFIPGKSLGKVRALFDTYLKTTKKALPGDAVEILGLTEVIPTGSILSTAPVTLLPEKPSQIMAAQVPHTLAQFFGEKDEDEMKIVLKTETSGEIEAIKNSLGGNITIVFEGQGDIGVSDILLAKDFSALVLGFNVVITREAKALAENEGVFYKMYGIIYELLDELKDATRLLQEARAPLGKSQILARFPSKGGDILGVKVLTGRLALHDKITILRGDTEIGSARVISLKRGKQDVKEVIKGLECGASITPAVDFAPGDMILSHNKKQ